MTGILVMIWILFSATPAGGMEQHQPRPTFQPIPQPLSHKLAVTALGGSLIAAELLWFLKK
jgi:plastocyanin domain-containing protein